MKNGAVTVTTPKTMAGINVGRCSQLLVVEPEDEFVEENNEPTETS